MSAELGLIMAQNYVHFTSHATSPATLLARCLVLASVPATHHRGGHILRFLLRFTGSLAPVLGSVSQLAALWEGRFLLLLHYLDQHREQEEAAQWQEDWLLGIVTDTVTIVHYLLFLSL